MLDHESDSQNSKAYQLFQATVCLRLALNKDLVKVEPLVNVSVTLFTKT